MASQKEIIFRKLQNIEYELSRIQNILFALKTTDIQAHGSNYQELSMDAAIRTEKITCQLRTLVFAVDFKNDSDYLDRAADAHGIRIHQKERILSITLPGLLPKRKSRNNTAFLHEPLNQALQKHMNSEGLEPYKDCVICFSQIYDESLSLLRIRDYDNLEFKQILDTVASYVLLDDSGLYCDCYHTTEVGEADCTVIYIMDKSLFPDWLKSRKEQFKNIWEIS